MFNTVACSARWGLVASIEIEVGVKRRVPLLPWGRVAGRPRNDLGGTVPCLWDRGVREMHDCISNKHQAVYSCEA